ncbi:MAG: ATP-binding cassette domain-containing protein, partial [Planctomycetota bacterium]|nr:ATP-binding cassette domain-containing protein [Planctomycetota bacterium]
MTDSLSLDWSKKPSSETKPRIVAQELLFRHGNTVLLNKVSLELDAGESLAIIGASGSGKSTLLKVLVGIEAADSGIVAIDGKTQGRSQLEARVGLVAQDDILYPDLSSEQTLENLAKLLRPDLSKDERIAEVDRILNLLELRTCARRPVKTLSGGQRKRVSIAMELLQNPKVFLLDEPLSNLDPALRRRFMRLFERLCQDGLSLIVTTHQLENLECFDKVLVLDKGHVTFFGAPKEMQEIVEKAGPSRDLFDVFSHERTVSPDGHPRTQNDPGPPEKLVPRHSIARALRHFPILCQRRGRRILKEHKRLFTLLIQGPTIAFFLSLSLSSPVQLLFMAVLTSIWMGVSASALEVVGEKDILRRERRLGVSVSASLFSRMTILSLLTSIQCLLLLIVLRSSQPISLGAGLFFILLQISAWTGLSLGFSISSNMSRSATAGLIIPLVMIPQVLFGGIFSRNEPSFSQMIERVVPSRYAFDLTARCALAAKDSRVVDQRDYEDSIRRWENTQQQWNEKIKEKLASTEEIDMGMQLEKSRKSLEQLKKKSQSIENQWRSHRDQWEGMQSEMAQQEADSEEMYQRAERLRTILPRDDSPAPDEQEDKNVGPAAKSEEKEQADWIDQTVDDARTLLDGVDDARSRQRDWTMKLDSMRRSSEDESDRLRGDWKRELKRMERQRLKFQSDLEGLQDRLDRSRSEFTDLMRAQEGHF